MKDWRIKLDCAFVVALAATATITLCSYKESKADETTQEPTTIATTAETTEAVTEATETEPPVTEATEPDVTEPEVTEETEPEVLLYNVPLGEDLQLHIIETANEYGIDPAIVFAMAYVESSFKTDCVGDSGDSLGLMQVQPYWHSGRMQRLGCTDLLDPFQNVTVAVDYLSEMLNRHDGDIAKALVSYNQGSYKGTITSYAKAVLATAEEVTSTK